MYKICFQIYLVYLLYYLKLAKGHIIAGAKNNWLVFQVVVEDHCYIFYLLYDFKSQEQCNPSRPEKNSLVFHGRRLTTVVLIIFSL